MVLKTKKIKKSAPKRDAVKSKRDVKTPKAQLHRKVVEKTKVIYSDWASI